MRITEFTNINPTLEEDWKSAAAGIGTALALGTGGMTALKSPTTTPSTTVTQPGAQAGEIKRPSAPEIKKTPSTPSEHQALLSDRAQAAGTGGAELTHFLSQASHETLGFKRMLERGTPEYFQKRYDKSGAPGRARRLGNTELGDGERFRGRGYIQLTGRYNYAQAGRALGLDLISNPDLAAEPEVAAEIAIWYWQKRVQPRVTDWNKTTVKAVTTPINPGGKGMASRERHFQKIQYQKK
jgi:putative chitinase